MTGSLTFRTQWGACRNGSQLDVLWSAALQLYC